MLMGKFVETLSESLYNKLHREFFIFVLSITAADVGSDADCDCDCDCDCEIAFALAKIEKPVSYLTHHTNRRDAACLPARV